MKTPKGYCIVGTGGGCDAFQRDLYDPQRVGRRIGYVLITAVGAAAVPETAHEPVSLGVYDTDERCTCLFDCPNVAAAVRVAAQIVSVQES